MMSTPRDLSKDERATIEMLAMLEGLDEGDEKETAPAPAGRPADDDRDLSLLEQQLNTLEEVSASTQATSNPARKNGKKRPTIRVKMPSREELAPPPVEEEAGNPLAGTQDPLASLDDLGLESLDDNQDASPSLPSEDTGFNLPELPEDDQAAASADEADNALPKTGETKAEAASQPDDPFAELEALMNEADAGSTSTTAPASPASDEEPAVPPPSEAPFPTAEHTGESEDTQPASAAPASSEITEEDDLLTDLSTTPATEESVEEAVDTAEPLSPPPTTSTRSPAHRLTESAHKVIEETRLTREALEEMRRAVRLKDEVERLAREIEDTTQKTAGLVVTATEEVQNATQMAQEAVTQTFDTAETTFRTLQEEGIDLNLDAIAALPEDELADRLQTLRQRNDALEQKNRALQARLHSLGQ